MSVFIVPVRRGINDRQTAVNSNLQNGGGRVKRGVLHKYTRHEACRIQNGGSYIANSLVHVFVIDFSEKKAFLTSVGASQYKPVVYVLPLIILYLNLLVPDVSS